MMHSKIRNHTASGFTLIETLIALVVISLVVSSIYLSVGTAFDSLSRSYERFTHMSALKNFFVESSIRHELDPDMKARVEKITKPTMDVTYEVQEIPKKSSLAKKIKDVKLVRAQGTWRSRRGEKQERFVSFVFVPPEEQKT